VLKQGDLQLALMHSEYFAGIGKFDYGTLAIPIDNTRAVGISVIRFAVDDIPDTIDLIDKDGNINYDRLRSFSTADYGFLFTYSKKTAKEGFRYGGNVKVIHRKVGEFANAWGFGLDLGAQYEHKNWTFGAMGKDITSTFNAWSYNTERLEDVFAVTGNDLPENGLEVTLPKVVLGAAYNIQLTEKIYATPEVDIDMTFDGKRNTVVKSDVVSIEPHGGVEFSYDNFLFLRAGVGNIQEVTSITGSESTTAQPNIGVGVKIKNVSIDYALTNIGNDEFLYSNVFSLKWNIFKKTE
ncbi:MAG: hypothetical protein KJO64_04385, partial [Bacteroidia bacterium]|nr:hypothetical protein [Bacteroidia bacterium]